MVAIKCTECGAFIELPTSYWNVEDTDVVCTQCKARLTVTLQNGQLKKLRAMES
jgi:DNA-directed RNA polymerase subunit RPC12/RpoP